MQKRDNHLDRKTTKIYKYWSIQYTFIFEFFKIQFRFKEEAMKQKRRNIWNGRVIIENN